MSDKNKNKPDENQPAIKNEKPESTRVKHVSNRQYYVRNDLDLAVDMLTDEESALKWIAEFGTVDTPYIIGYSVERLEPVTKTMKVQINK